MNIKTIEFVLKYIKNFYTKMRFYYVALFDYIPLH